MMEVPVVAATSQEVKKRKLNDDNNINAKKRRIVMKWHNEFEKLECECGKIIHSPFHDCKLVKVTYCSSECEKCYWEDLQKEYDA